MTSLKHTYMRFFPYLRKIIACKIWCFKPINLTFFISRKVKFVQKYFPYIQSYNAPFSLRIYIKDDLYSVCNIMNTRHWWSLMNMYIKHMYIWSGFAWLFCPLFHYCPLFYCRKTCFRHRDKKFGQDPSCINCWDHIRNINVLI